MATIRPLASIALAAALLGCGGAAGTANTPAGPAVAPVAIPGGLPGIGFDDLRFSTTHGVLAPAGRAGVLALIQPDTRQASTIGGFTADPKYDGHHDTGITSADEGAGLLFVVDRSSKKLSVVDPGKGAVIASADLAAGPDYVRYVALTGELWVTEPDAEQLEIFSLSTAGAVRVTRAAAIKFHKGPEELVVDSARGRAYANSWKSETFAVDLRSRSITATWKNACKKSRGVAFEPAAGFLFIGCSEGGAVTLDVNTGRQVGAAPAGEGVDIIAYSPSRRHLYVPGGKARTMTIMAVSKGGFLTPLGAVPTAEKAHCVTTDDRGTAYVCDPDHGQLLAIRDPFVPSL